MSLGSRLNLLASKVGADIGLLEKRVFSRPLGPFEAALSRAWIKPCRIVWLGSSTTYGVAATNPSLDFVSVATQRLQGAYPSIIGGYEKPVVNVAFQWPVLDKYPGVQSYRSAAGGATSETYVNDVNKGFILWHEPDLIVHSIGLNDSLDVEPYAVPVNEYQANVAAAVDYFDNGSSKPISQILVHSYKRSEVSEAKWATYRQALYNIAKTRPNVLVIELQEEFDLMDAFGADPYGLIADGLHPSDAGHAFIADIILKKMNLTISSGHVEREFVLDTFTRPNVAGLGPPDRGNGSFFWFVPDTANSISTVSANTMRFTTGGTVLLESGLSDLEVDTMITLPAPSGTGLPGLVFRAKEVANRMGVYCNAISGQFQLYKTIAGVTTSVAATPHPFPAGDYIIQVRTQGDRVWAYVNGVKQIDYTMTQAEVDALAGLTQIGFRNGSTAPDVKYHFIRASRL